MTDFTICQPIALELDALENAIDELCDPVLAAMIRDRKNEIKATKEAEPDKGAGITNVAMSDCDNIVGLARISHFRGETMHINPEYLKRAIEMADALFENVNDIEIGISNETPGGAFFILLNKKRAAALVVAGRLSE